MRLIDADDATKWAREHILDAKERFVIIDFLRDCSTIDAVPVEKYEELKIENDTLKRLVNGEWVDTDEVEKALGISFAEGMKMFDFSRTADWNPDPLHGQKITTKFRLRCGERKDG